MSKREFRTKMGGKFDGLIAKAVREALARKSDISEPVISKIIAEYSGQPARLDPLGASPIPMDETGAHGPVAGRQGPVESMPAWTAPQTVADVAAQREDAQRQRLAKPAQVREFLDDAGGDGFMATIRANRQANRDNNGR